MSIPISMTFHADSFTALAEQLKEAGHTLEQDQQVPAEPSLGELSVDEIMAHLKERVDGDGMTVIIKEKPKRRGRKPKSPPAEADGETAETEETSSQEPSTDEDEAEDVLPAKTRKSKAKGNGKSEAPHIPGPSKGVPPERQEYEQALAMLSTCYASPKGKPAVRKLLQDYGVAKFSEIPETEGADLLEKAVEILNAVKGK